MGLRFNENIIVRFIFEQHNTLVVIDDAVLYFLSLLYVVGERCFIEYRTYHELLNRIKPSKSALVTRYTYVEN